MTPNITKTEVHKLWLDMLYTINEVAKSIVSISEGLCRSLERMKEVIGDDIYDNGIFSAFKSPEMLSVEIPIKGQFSIAIHIKLNKKGNTLDSIMLYMEDACRAISLKDLYNIMPTPIVNSSIISNTTRIVFNFGGDDEYDGKFYISINKLIDIFNRFKDMTRDPVGYFTRPIHMLSATYQGYYKQ